MEVFEITFFISKEKYVPEMRNDFLHNLDKIPLSERRQDFFCEYGKDYVEIRWSFLELKFTTDKLHETLETLGGSIDTLFAQYTGIAFATGVYEITHYLVGKERSLADFDAAVLHQFPIVFLRQNGDYGMDNIVIRKEHVVCAYHKEGQDLFSVM